MSVIHQLRWLWKHPASDGLPTMMRAAAWMARSAAGRSAVVPYGEGLRFYCPPEARGIARMTYIFRDMYEPELAELNRFVKWGDRVVDVGAHYGTYTLKLARLVGDSGEVIAVEPAAHAVEVLRHNLELNALQNVRVEHVAAGEHVAEALLRVDRNPARNALMQGEGRTGVTEKIRMVPLDDLIGAPISFMKVDVEGAELLVFRGASRVLQEYRPVVQFEYTPAAARDMGLDPREVWDRLEGHGYRMHELVGGKLRPMGQVPAEGLVNVTAIPST